MMNANTARKMTIKAIEEKEAKTMSYAENIVNWLGEIVIKPAAKEGKSGTYFTDPELHEHFSYLEMTGTDKALEILKELGYEVEVEYTNRGNIYILAW